MNGFIGGPRGLIRPTKVNGPSQVQKHARWKEKHAYDQTEATTFGVNMAMMKWEVFFFTIEGGGDVTDQATLLLYEQISMMKQQSNSVPRKMCVLDKCLSIYIIPNFDVDNSCDFSTTYIFSPACASFASFINICKNRKDVNECSGHVNFEEI